MPRFVKDDKYFECICVGDTVLRGAGKIGRKPRSHSKDYDDEEAARAALAKLVAKQEKAGFVHVHDRLEALSEFAVNETYRDRDLLERVVSAGIDLSFSESDGWTPLHEACLSWDFDIALVLVRGGAPADAALKRAHSHPLETIRKGTTPLQLARVALDRTANEPPDDPNAALIRSVVELMEGTSGTSDQRDDGAKAEPSGPGFDEDTYGAVVFGQRVEGLSRAAIAKAMTRATDAVGVFPGGDLGDTRAVADDTKNAGVPVCVGQCVVFASADDGEPVPVNSKTTIDAADVTSRVQVILDGVCEAPVAPARLWLVTGGPLASAKVVVGERVPGRPDDNTHRGATMTQDPHSDGVRGRLLAASEDVDPLPDLQQDETAYLVVRYD